MNGKLHFDYVRNFGLCTGDIADIHLGTIKDAVKLTPVLLKIARNQIDNDLLKNEADVLKALTDKFASEKKSQTWNCCVPKILDSFQVTADDGKPKPQVNILEFFTGFISGEDIRKISTGIDGRTLVWMWKRTLGVLSWIHHFGYVHGAVLPPHVLFFPDGSIKDERTHAIRLVDWCYAVNEKERLKAWIPDYKDFYPPEVINKNTIKPSTDLYMAAKTMIYLTGGDVIKNKFPTKIPPQLGNQIKKCLDPVAHRRPQNVSAIFDAFKATAKDVYGEPKFHEFKLGI